MHEVTQRRVLYDMPGADRVVVKRNLEFTGADGAALAFDLYRPPDPSGSSRPPLVIIVGGFTGEGVVKMLGCQFKDMAFSIGWAKLFTASGLAAITYTNSAPVADVRALLAHVRAHADDLGIDETRLGLWASSGHGPLAVSLLMEGSDPHVRCAALCYAYTLDLDGATGVADAARQWGFVNACADKSVSDLRRDVPMLVVRAGQDQMPGLNGALDRFVTGALARNLPMSCTNLPTAPHAFDLELDTEQSHETIRYILRFLTANLRG